MQHLHWEERRVQSHAVFQLQTRLLLDVPWWLEDTRLGVLRVLKVTVTFNHHTVHVWKPGLPDVTVKCLVLNVGIWTLSWIVLNQQKHSRLVKIFKIQISGCCRKVTRRKKHIVTNSFQYMARGNWKNGLVDLIGVVINLICYSLYAIMWSCQLLL